MSKICTKLLVRMTKAVQGVSFDVQQGEIFSLLGPNGAGKTTTISMLSCLLRPDERRRPHHGPFHPQRCRWRVKAVLGVVPQDIALYEDLSARENLTFWGKMYGLRGAALQAARRRSAGDDRPDRARQKTGSANISGGMKRRVNIGVALLHKPQVIYHGRAHRGHRPAVPPQHPGQREGAQRTRA